MLQGTLNDFSLPDVFSLLALTKKSGALRVTAAPTDGRVYFRDGAVCLALSDAKRVPLVARLVSAGLVDEEQLRDVIDQHKGSSLAVTEALLTSGKVEDRVLGGMLREQIVDAIFELMRLKEGEFSFDAAEPGLSRGVALSVMEVVGEAQRRLDEWQAISTRIASRDAVLAMVPAGVDNREGVNLAGEQWDLLALIDGRRTVAEVVDLTGKGEFATCRVLGDLVEAGLVEAQDPADNVPTRLSALIAAREALRSLEQVGQSGGLRPDLSSAAAVPDGGSAVRWIEPVKDDKPAPAVKPVALAPRTRVDQDENMAAEPRPSSPTAARPAEASKPTLVPAAVPADSSTERTSAPAAHNGHGAGSTTPAAPPAADGPEEPAAVSPTSPATPPASSSAAGSIDRAQVARELASLGLDDLSDIRPEGERSASRLTRDEEVNKGLLLRLIDGVKGA